MGNIIQIGIRHEILILYVLALSSWERIIETEDLDKVAEVAPLMQVFGYKPEIYRGECDQFKSQVSKFDLRLEFTVK